MVKVKISVIPPRPKHELFNIKWLAEIILSFCQYDDAKEYFKSWRCKKPERFLLNMEEVKELDKRNPDKEYFIGELYLVYTASFLKDFPEKLYGLIGQHDKVYVPYNKDFPFKADIYELLVEKRIRVKWQCPTCLKYKEIKYDQYDKQYCPHITNLIYFVKDSQRVRSLVCGCISKTTPVFTYRQNYYLGFDTLQTALDNHYGKLVMPERYYQ